MDSYSQPDSQAPRAVPAPPPPPAHTTAVVDLQIHQRLLRDYQRLKVRVDLLEKENENLRASLWEVSWRWGKGANKGKGRDKVVQDDEQDQDEETSTESNNNTNSLGSTAARPASTATSGTGTPPSQLDPAGSPVTPKAVASTTLAHTAHDLPPPASAPVPTSTVATSAPATSHSPSVSNGDFMRLNEPIRSTPPTPPSVNQNPNPLPTTPSSLAASLFPPTSSSAGPSSSPLAPTRPTPAPSSTSSRTTPAHRDATLKRDLDISLPLHRSREFTSGGMQKERWRWGRGYDLKGHRGAVYALKFSEGELSRRGRVLASAGFDGVRVWGPKELVEGAEADTGEDEGDAWDDGDVEEIAHLTSHSGPVSDVSFSPDMSHILSGGYDAQLFVHPLAPSIPASPTPTPASSPIAPPTFASSNPYAPIWSLATDGLVQSVAWLHPSATAHASESGNVFAWGTSGKVLGIGDLRMEKAAMEIRCDAMVNSVQSFRRSPTLLVGDSSGSIRHFSLRASAFLPFPEASVPTPTTASAKKGPPPISCLALNPDWSRKAAEPRWLANVGFDNFIRVYDRGTDPLKMAVSPPKLVQTLKGKNRNWPIKTAWFQGHDYADTPPPSKRRTANPSQPTSSSHAGGSSSRARSRSASFSSDHPDHLSDDDDEDHLRRHARHRRQPSASGGGSGEGDGDGTTASRRRPLSSSLLLASGSSDPVVLLYDLSGVSAPASSDGGSSGAGGGAKLVQRLEGHKESVYAVDWLQSLPPGEDGSEPSRDGYRGDGLLGSAGGDWVVKIWKPIFELSS